MDLKNQKCELNDNALKELKKILKAKIIYGKGMHRISLYDLATASSSSYSTPIEYFFKKVGFIFGKDTTDRVKRKIQDFLKVHYKTSNDAIYHAFFHEFYDWLISPVGKELDDEQVKNLFSSWYANYIQFERLIGLTQQRLHSINGSINNFTFKRQEALNTIQKFCKNQKKLLLLNGEPGTGKSSLIKQWLSDPSFLDSDYIFIDIRDYLHFEKSSGQFLTPSKFKDLNYICFDNIELALFEPSMQDKIKNLIKNLRRSSIKLIFLLRSESVILCKSLISNLKITYDEYKLKELELTEVLSHYDFLDSFNLIPAACKLITIPFYLNLLVQHQNYLTQNKSIDTEIQEASLKIYLIRLSIENSTNKAANTKIIKNRKAILRELVFTKTKNKTTYVSLKETNNQEAIESLVSDGILVKNNKQKYDFSHPLYEEWVVEQIVSSLLKQATEAEETPKQFCKRLFKLLPKHSQTYGLFLQNSKEFSFLLKNNKANFDDSLSNLANLALSLIAGWANIEVYPSKSKEKYKVKLNSWMQHHNPNDVLFIFSPKNQIWKAYLIINKKKELEKVTIDSTSSYASILNEVSPCRPSFKFQNIHFNSDEERIAKLKILLKNQKLFKHFHYNFSEDYIDNILSMIYQVAAIQPNAIAEFFKKLDFEDAVNFIYLRDNSYITNLLNRLANHQSSFAIAIDTLCKLASIDYDYYDAHNCDHIQYIIDTIFYPVSGTIEPENRLQYLKNRITSNGENYIPLIRALKCIVDIASGKADLDILGGKIDSGNSIANTYELLPSSLLDDYCNHAASLLIEALKFDTTQDEADSILCDYIENNLGNLLLENFSRLFILKILKSIDWENNDYICSVIEATYQDFATNKDTIISKISQQDFYLCYERLKIFYQMVKQCNSNYLFDEDNEHESDDKTLNLSNSTTIGYNQHGLFRISESIQKTVSTTSSTNVAKNSAQLSSSIFDLEQNAKRDKLPDEEMVKQKLVQLIPAGFQLGAAIGQGDCFFDALAQGLNQLVGKEEYTAKSLRLMCDEYVKNLENADWVKDAVVKNGGNYEQYLSRIQFTADEIERMKQQGGVDLGQAEWGNPHIEGRIICEVLQAKHNLIFNLHIIEVLEQAIKGVKVLEQQVDSVSAKSIDPLVTKAYQATNLVHLVNYKNHFVPLLDSKKIQTEKLLTQFAEHSLFF